MKRLLITGAAGSLGAMCRQRLPHLAETIPSELCRSS